MLKSYIVGVVSSLTSIFILKLLEYFKMHIQEKINLSKRGMQFSFLFIFFIYSYLIFSSEGIHKFVLGLFLIITIIAWAYFIPKETYTAKAKKKLNGVTAKKEDANKIPNRERSRSKETVVDIKKKLEKDRQHILLTVSKYPKLEVVEIAKQLSIDADVAAFHLEELKKTKFARVLYIQGSAWDNIPYREEWITDQLGREYLIHHKLIQ